MFSQNQRAGNSKIADDYLKNIRQKSSPSASPIGTTPGTAPVNGRQNVGEFIRTQQNIREDTSDSASPIRTSRVMPQRPQAVAPIPQVATPERPASLGVVGAAEVPISFKQHSLSPIAYLTRDKLETVLPSYLPDTDKQADVMNKWEGFIDEKTAKYQTVPQLIEQALGTEAAKASIEYVKTKNAEASPDGDAISTLSRADARDHAKIIEAKGFHGWGGSMSVEHARSWVTDVWNHMSNSAKGAWMQNWKATTSNPTDSMPFVATGWESQKAGNEYQIRVPFEIPNPRVTPQVAFDGETVENSSVICVTGRDEVVFLTGVPEKYITPKKP
jgi:hypothetical protein